MQFALREPYANGFLHRLDGAPRLLEICGLPCAPSESAYSKFKKKLVEIPDFMDYIDKMIADVFLECGEEIERLRDAGLIPEDTPPLGEALTMDSTDMMAWARPARTSRKTGKEVLSKDSDAKWGHRTAKNRRSSKISGEGGRKKAKVGGKSAVRDGDNNRKASNDEFFFGYSFNVIVDSNHGLPLRGVVRPANTSDTVIMIEDLDDCLELYRTLSPTHFLGDKGYDRLENMMHLVSIGMIPIIAVREPPRDKETGKRLYDGTYDVKGRPTCIGGQSMDYIETDPDRGHLFRCPEGGCSLKGRVNFTGYCDFEHHEKPEGPLLRIIGLVPRCSAEWKNLYKLRTGIERFFSSNKHSRLMDKHRYFNIRKMSMHATMSMLSYLATALAHLKADDYAHMRHMRIRLPRDREEKPSKMPNRDMVAAWMMYQFSLVRQVA